MIRASVRSAWGLALLVTVGLHSHARAELRPDELAILANEQVPESLAVAEHYAARRHIPPTHIIRLDLPMKETMTRSDYEERLVQPVRHALRMAGLAEHVRVLVTIYGVPLRLDAPKPTDEEAARLQEALERLRYALAYLEKARLAAERVGIDQGAEMKEEARSNPPAAPDTGGLDETFLVRVNEAVREAARRVQRAKEQGHKGPVKQWEQQIAALTLQVGGSATVIANLKPSASADPQQAKAEIQQLKQQIGLAQRVIPILVAGPSATDRRRGYELAERVFGLQSVARLANGERERFEFKNGEASVDSELSLLWWDRDEYVISGRLPNPLFHQTLPPRVSAAMPPIMLVSRLDAPTAALAMNLVDQALAAEEHGLSGNVYVDARGIKPDGKLGYGDYDQGLRDLAEIFRRHTPYPVVVDDTERRFSEPGEAPNVAVYVGWYRLRAYEDAFTFMPGAIGYHIASGEAVSIHDPKETGWCKNALERGITATLGPTGEPYVDAFPMAKDFFALLGTGRYSLAEAFALTSRYISWRMVLFGDPLYNPWRGRGFLSEDDTVISAVRKRHGAAAPAPLTLPFSNPLKARQEIKQQRETALAQARSVADQLTRPQRKKTR
ncbi:TIGR03790 family protein [Candidatus Nitrospira bockiana]